MFYKKLFYKKNITKGSLFLFTQIIEHLIKFYYRTRCKIYSHTYVWQ